MRRQRYATGVSYHTAEVMRQKQQGIEIFPGLEASHIRAQNPIVIVRDDIWYREEKLKENRENRIIRSQWHCLPVTF